MRHGMLLVGMVAGLIACGARAADGPRVLLYLPFDGSAYARFAADGYGKASYTTIDYSPGKRGQAARIGSRYYPCGLMIPAALDLDKARGSLELWVRLQWDATDPRSGAEKILATDEKADGDAGHFMLRMGGPGLGFVFRTPSTTLNAGASIADWKAGAWHHVVASWDSGSGLRLFVDGKLAAEQKGTWDPSATPPSQCLYLGATSNGRNVFDGSIDELHIYDRALTAEEAAAAFEGSLQTQNAQARRVEPAPAPTARRTPKIIFHATFDDTAKASEAAGKPEPLEATNVKYAPGLVGRALDADEGLVLSYDGQANLNKAAGAISMWVAPKAGGLSNNCAYFADEFDTWQLPTKTVNALWLWMWNAGAGTPELRFDVRPPITETAAQAWQPGEWHHLAACWEAGRELTLYVDGQRMDAKTGDAARFVVEAASKFFIGSYGGRMPAQALIDEVKVFDGPLSPEEVQAEARAFVLPVTLDLGRTLFERGQGATLPVRFFNPTEAAVSYKLDVRVLDPAGKQVFATAAPIDASSPAHGWGETPIGIPGEAIQNDGLYHVLCEPRSAVAKHLTSYFLVVPPIPAQKPSDGVATPEPKLQLVDEIDCTQDLGPERMATTGKSKVVTSPLGAYREAGPDRNDRMAFRFKVQRPGVWHVIKVTYPDDKKRSCDIISNSPKYWQNVYDVATGYLCGDEARISGKMIDLPIWFTPREEDNALVFMTLEPREPAAVAKISVYEVVDGLPPAAMRVPSDGGRRIGNYWEDPTICMEHGALDFSPPEVYKSFSRLIDYLRFSGQSLICYPIAWYLGTMFPSARESFRMGPGADRHSIDWVEYALRLCERRGVRFLPEMYWAGSYALQDQWKGQSQEKIWAGEPTVKCMTWDGTESGGSYFNPPYYNPIHPIMRKALEDYVDEALDRYAKYPALEGISLIVGEGNCVWFGSIQSGYDDYTVGLFEQETGVKVPADKAGPARFSQRFRWLMKNAPDKWVQWRCEKIRDLHRDIADRIQKRRPGLKLYLTFYSVDGHNFNPMFNLDTWVPRGRTADQIYREGGFDTRLYRDLPGIVLRKVTYPIDYRFYKSYYAGGGPNSHEILCRDLDLLSEGIGPFKNSSLPGTVFHCRYFESSIGADSAIPGYWWKCHPWRVSQPTDSGRNFLEYYAHAVAELDAASLAYGGYTVTSMGHEEELRDFARYYRALPAERFKGVPGMSDPVCARELQKDGRRYLYLVNRMPYAMKAYVAFSGEGVAAEDLASGQKLALPAVRDRVLPAAMPKGFVSEHDVPAKAGPTPVTLTQQVTGALLEAELPAYAMRSYGIEPVGAAIVYAASEAPSGEVDALAQRLAAARQLLAASRAETAKINLAQATLALALRAYAKREYSRAGYLLDSFPLARLTREAGG